MTEDEYDKRAEEYYARKTVHREELLPGCGCLFFIVVCLIFWTVLGWVFI